MLVSAPELSRSVQRTTVPFRSALTFSGDDKTDTSDPFVCTVFDMLNDNKFDISGGLGSEISSVLIGVIDGSDIRKLAVIFHRRKVLLVLHVMASSSPGHTLASPEGDCVKLDSTSYRFTINF